MSKKMQVLVSVSRKELSGDDEPWGFNVYGTFLKGEDCDYLIYEEIRDNSVKVKHRIKIEKDRITVTEDMPSQHIEVIYSEKEDHDSVVAESGLVIDVHTHTKKLSVKSSKEVPVEAVIVFSTTYNREADSDKNAEVADAELTIKATPLQ